MITNTLDDLLQRLGAELDDPALSASSTGRIGGTSHARVVRALDLAARQDFAKIRGDRADISAFLTRIDLSLDANDTTKTRYKTTPRTSEVALVYDATRQLVPLPAYRTGAAGYVVEEGGHAVRLRNLTSTDINGTISAWVINEPIRLSRATATTVTASSFVLAATPGIGVTDVQNDFYNGARFAIVSGTDAGTIGRVTDYAGSSRVATVQCDSGSLTSGATTNVYSFVLDVPAQMSDSVVLRAALIVARTDAKMREFMTDLRAAYAEAYRDALVRVDKMMVNKINSPRQAWNFAQGTETLV